MTNYVKDSERTGPPEPLIEPQIKPSSPPPANQPHLSAPSSLLHPTLLEKMRLDSPTIAHMRLSTRNQRQSPHEMNQTLYKLQSDAPFPKLPPYFVHKEGSGDGNGDFETAESCASEPRIRRRNNVKIFDRRLKLEESDDESNSRNSSTRQSVQCTKNKSSKCFKNIITKFNSLHPVILVLPQDGLARQAWIFPQDEDT